MRLIKLTDKDMGKYEVVQQVINGNISTEVATAKLKLSDRQVRRLKARVRESGINGVIHKNRNRVSNRRIDPIKEELIITIIQRKYSDFGPTLAHEKLNEIDMIECKLSTVRNIMINNDIWTPKKAKKPTPHTLRLRRAMYGEMIQYDGSYHLWFENRGTGEKVCLLLAVDDATGCIVHAKFDKHEGVFPTFTFWQEYIKKHGIPTSIYHDRFSTYTMNQKLAKENPDTMTQFQRAMRSLNVEMIAAGSSQAKGRVENFFGTLQDRLVKELRLQVISTVEKANTFLIEVFIPYYNKKFAVAPRKDGNAHIGLTKEKMKVLPSIFSRHTERVVTNDFTIRFKNHIMQLTKKQPVNVFPKDTIIVEEHLNGCWYLRSNSKYLNFKILVGEPQKLNQNVAWILEKNTNHQTSPLIN